jgi:flagellar hook-length control protein FliK
MPGSTPTVAQGTEVNPPVAQQVAAQLTAFRGRPDGSYETTLRLVPEELGEVTIRLQVNGGTVSLHAMGASAAAVDALRDAMPDLRQDLLRSGLDLVDSQVDQSPGSQGRDAQADRDSASTGERRTVAPVTSNLLPTAAAGDGGSAVGVMEGGRVDVRI